jgi:peptidoglycan/xylan/chitin deacetylase (PgdA/CDA1 family)
MKQKRLLTFSFIALGAMLALVVFSLPEHPEKANQLPVVCEQDPKDSLKVMPILGFSDKFKKSYEAATLKTTVESLARKQPALLYLNGQTHENKVSLTFDDGPHPVNTPIILSILERYGIKAAFFCIGKNLKRHPHTAMQIHNAGHLLLNHSYSHIKFTKTDSITVAYQIITANDAVFETIGKKPRLVRVPYGAVNQQILDIIAEQNMRSVYWSADTYDWLETKEFVISLLRDSIRPDEIILLHGRGNTLENLPQIIELIQEKGFTIVPLDELLGEEAYF